MNSRVPSVSPSDWPASTKRTSMPGSLPSLSASSRARGFGLLGAVVEFLARALVDDDDRDRGQRIAVLAGDRGIGERQHEQRDRDDAHIDAARLREHEQEREHDRTPRSRSKRTYSFTSGEKATPKFMLVLTSFCSSVSAFARRTTVFQSTRCRGTCRRSPGSRLPTAPAAPAAPECAPGRPCSCR